MGKKALLFLSAIVLLFSCQKDSKQNILASENSTKPDSITIGTIQTLTSKFLNEDRKIVISLPAGYKKSKSSYPVLYLTDGFQNIEHVRGSVELLTRTGHIPPIIIVGIKSVDRVRDFTYTKSENSPKSGGGKQFLSFIESELIPYIDTNYRTNNFRVLEGHSLGGLFTASTLLEKPNLFQSYIVMSPAFWWNKEELTHSAKAFFKTQLDQEKRLFFGIGKDESAEDFGMRKELINFVNVIKDSNQEKLRYSHKEFENEGHMSSTLLSNYHGLRYIFSDLKYSNEFIANYSDEAFLKKEKELTAKYGENAKRTGESYYNLGASIYQENLPGAITVFKRSVEVYPNDINLITTLAKLYEKSNETANAVNTYKLAIEVATKNKYGNEAAYQKEINRLTRNTEMK